MANLALVYVFWGSTYLAMRFALSAWPPFLLGAARFLAAGLLMLGAAKFLGQSLRLERQALVTSVVSGLILFPVGNGAVLWAEQTTSSGLAATLIATTPIWMTLAAWFLGTHGRPTLRVAASLGLGLTGVGLLVANGGGAITPTNALILLVGAAFWATTSVWVAKRQPGGSLLVRSAVQMLAGGLGFVVMALFRGEAGRSGPALLTPVPLLAAGYLVVFGSCVGYVAFAWLVGHVPPHIAGTYAFVNPVIAVMLGALFGEQVSPQGILAIVLVVAGVALAAVVPDRTAELERAPLAE